MLTFDMRRALHSGLLFGCVTFVPIIAFAHTGQGDISGGVLAGFRHPISGLDHVVAMVAVGLWGAQLGRPAIWVLPVTFPIVMAFGGVLGGLGVSIPGIEVGIALSALLLGAAVALALTPPLWFAGLLVALFAICHGHAHGAELPESANPVTYAIGFVAATGTLHALGILIGTVNRWKAGSFALRTGGAFISGCGCISSCTRFEERDACVCCTGWSGQRLAV
ncbi:Protein HupE (modular protein) [Paraburkholderia piptadeniae]|uniref:Protein HupE (Modular protein) n=1 Tax=Paraburkholderia piptadeniae TaxID=1701573 RepID=A0A1N7SEL9_9BURK|nr:HupE/UreJ family protein [Paraburkholderia piptadeniae]SIT45780.1 Protein HupE (modular protein) [Paraburkholderia piptadeniae]